ncbi:Uncharacterized protein Fot_31823 [Forsythia ovata]|uniref:Uncharacterized protein n=1 Tax=Forsythia ovata TaxID=205694 RepID=A0ABD1T616_9LAMI
MTRAKRRLRVYLGRLKTLEEQEKNLNPGRRYLTCQKRHRVLDSCRVRLLKLRIPNRDGPERWNPLMGDKGPKLRRVDRILVKWTKDREKLENLLFRPRTHSKTIWRKDGKHIDAGAVVALVVVMAAPEAYELGLWKRKW